MNDEDIVRRLMALDEDAQKHFRQVISVLLECYEKDSSASALVLHSDTQGMFQMVPIRADMQGIIYLMRHATAIVDVYTIAGAPPKEMFN